MAARARMAAVSPWKAPVPVLCIGNLVAGGSGKTPVALSLGARLAASGLDVHFLSRGYSGSVRGPLRVDPGRHNAGEVGDESLLLAACAPAWISVDRPAGARLAAEDGAGVIVMDDGFQNPSLCKDVSLLVADGGYGFGNGRVIPAGPLRESIETGLIRANAVIVIGDDEAGVADQVSRLSAKELPVLHARVRPGPEADRLKDRDVVAFAGIGMPEKFFSTLRAVGCRLVAAHPFPDHYPYAEEDISRLRARARQTESLLVTTAKDAARLPANQRQDIEVLTIAIEWDDETALKSVLEPLVQS